MVHYACTVSMLPLPDKGLCNGERMAERDDHWMPGAESMNCPVSAARVHTLIWLSTHSEVHSCDQANLAASSDVIHKTVHRSGSERRGNNLSSTHTCMSVCVCIQ